MFTEIYDSPIGKILIAAGDTAVIVADFFDGEDLPGENPNAVTNFCAGELAEYFAGRLTAFTAPIAPEGTQFRQRVWNELCRIPYGETISYAQLADRIGDAKAVRAVGGANHHNPISIIVPCHRVIGANGALVGYGGGLWRKEWLISHEKSQRT